jgi:signal transduction histidine kinase
MAYLLIIDPSPHVIILIGLCIFFLGEAFFSINISTGGRFTYPITFLRIFSLTIVTMFIYYLNRREAFVREQLGLLTQKLKDVDRRKSEFMANVSHELRTPLTSIKNAAVLLTKKVVSHQDGINISEGELTDIIISNVDRQYKLLDDLFNLARSEKGEIYKPRTLIDIGKLVERVVRSISIEADKKNIEIISNIQQDLPNIYVIADQLTEVYINLLDNAVKYNKENGKIILKIRLVDNKIESTIEDTGVGIPPKSLGRLFGRGSRFRNNNNHNVKGMGLGLSITKEIIESHSGNIWMESKLNVGTKFTFTLPRGLREVNGTGKSHK